MKKEINWNFEFGSDTEPQLIGANVIVQEINGVLDFKSAAEKFIKYIFNKMDEGNQAK